MIKSILNRVVSDYFLKDRIANYDRLIKKAIENGYTILKHSEYFELAKKELIGDKKILLLRHDIDSDPKYALKWLEIDKKYKIQTSYYFRLVTIDVDIMKAVNDQGGDCGYHYEELATIVKEKALTRKMDLTLYFNECATRFSENLKMVENKCGFKIRSVVSHGDFANRKIGLSNHVFVTPELLKENGLDFEGYQSEFVENYSINIMDLEYPHFYKGDVSPMESIEKDYQIVHLLLHPKNWKANWWANTLENGRRLREGLIYSFRTR